MGSWLDNFPANRVLSLDVFRGATILAMILVNNPGTWGAIYPPLAHAEWHGWTPTDLIFPFFLFIVGVAISYAFPKYLDKGSTKEELLRKVFWRSVKIFGLGLLMSGWPYFTLDGGFGLHSNLAEIRIPGVLERIAVCYLIASLIYLYASPKTMFYWLWGFLLFYWFAMTQIPVPGYGAGMIDDPEANLAAWIDRLILTETHMYRGGPYDPEGIFSTLPAIGTTLFGVWAGRILRQDVSNERRVTELLLWGFVLLMIGYIWSGVFPINKPIWTSSYSVFTAGLAMSGLGLCYWLIDVHQYRKYTYPFLVYGVNAIVVFFFSGIVARSMYMITWETADGTEYSLHSWIYQTVFAPIPGTEEFTSMLFAFLWIFAWFIVLHVMYKKEIFIKV